MKNLTKYRMIYENGSWCETFDLKEAEAHINFVVIEYEVEDEVYENAKLIHGNVILTN